MSLPEISQTSLKAISDIFSKGFKLIKSNQHQLSPHIKIISEIVVENVTKKSEYAPDVSFLVNNGMSVANAAKVLGISTSYAYKLLRNNLK